MWMLGVPSPFSSIPKPFLRSKAHADPPSSFPPFPAKRAFLTLVTTPPPLLQPSTVEPYTGSDVQSILSAVANRPRSRSIAGQGSVSGPAGGHSRKGSLLGSGGGSALGAAIASAQAAGPHGAATASATSPSSGVSPVPVSASHGHARTGSWQRSSISSPLSGIPRANGGAGSPVDAFEGGRASPDTLAGGAAGNGVIAGEAPRRYGTGPINGGGHARRGAFRFPFILSVFSSQRRRLRSLRLFPLVDLQSPAPAPITSPLPSPVSPSTSESSLSPLPPSLFDVPFCLRNLPAASTPPVAQPPLYTTSSTPHPSFLMAERSIPTFFLFSSTLDFTSTTLFPPLHSLPSYPLSHM